MSRYRIAFFGTPSFAVPGLQALVDGPDEVVGVVCQPDRPAGRGQHLTAPPVKELALARGLPVLQPEKVRTADFLAELRAWQPDLAVVAAYGRILPLSVLELPRLGCINVHASLLPRYRGAAPIQWAILRGETETGITIMQMNERMDEGDILLQEATPIGADETYGELQDRLAALGAGTLMRALAALERGELVPRPQDHSRATLAPMIKKEDGRIDWSSSAAEIARCVRGFAPWPSAFTTLGGKLLKIHRARPATAHATGAAPGTVLNAGNTIDVATGSGVLEVQVLQLAGRKALAAAEFAHSGATTLGVRLGS